MYNSFRWGTDRSSWFHRTAKPHACEHGQVSEHLACHPIAPGLAWWGNYVRGELST